MSSDGCHSHLEQTILFRENVFCARKQTTNKHKAFYVFGIPCYSRFK